MDTSSRIFYLVHNHIILKSDEIFFQKIEDRDLHNHISVLYLPSAFEKFFKNCVNKVEQ